MFHTATVRPRRSGPRILYNTPLSSFHYIVWLTRFSYKHKIGHEIGHVFSLSGGARHLFFPLQHLRTDFLAQRQPANKLLFLFSKQNNLVGASQPNSIVIAALDL